MNVDKLGALLHVSTVEQGRLQPLVFLAQAFGDSYGYSFDVHHFKVFSPALEADLSCLSTQQTGATSTLTELSSFIVTNVLAANLSEVELAAAQVYFEQKGYSTREIEEVLTPDAQLLAGARKLMTKLASYETRSLTATAAR